ncbi:MAG: Hsp20/alpha crystallin family protein [Gammaproteobacteria bacterium]|nr:Hsp20/alpha crystallin family protein [Gammaproteobacteria bacterium]
MNQLIYSPLRSLNELHRELSRVFEDRHYQPGTTSYEEGNWTPHVDIREQTDSFKVLVDIPGVAAKDVDITLDRNILTIRGVRKDEAETEEDNFRRRERIMGTFIRQFTLPDSANGEAISARAKEGVLEITIPKGEKHKPLSIKVNG